jgi:hypothetical protein
MVLSLSSEMAQQPLRHCRQENARAAPPFLNPD